MSAFSHRGSPLALCGFYLDWPWR